MFSPYYIPLLRHAAGNRMNPGLQDWCKQVYFFNLDDMQQGEYSCVANFSRLFNEILVRYENLFSYQHKKPKFVCKQNIHHHYKW